MRSARLAALGSPLTNFAGAFAFPAAAGAGLPESEVLLKRARTRSAASISVNSVASCARSASRRASRSLSFIFSAMIWSDVVVVVVGILTFWDFQVDRHGQSEWHLSPQYAPFNHGMFDRLPSLWRPTANSVQLTPAASSNLSFEDLRRADGL